MPRPERLVLCGGALANGAKDALVLDLNGAKRTFRLEINDISKAMTANVPARLVDLLEIACYAFAADQETSRGGAVRSKLGEDWRRRFRLRIPVRDHEFWSRTDVIEALGAALGFLSEDQWRFEFISSERPVALQDYLPLDEEAAFAADEIALFSGGADSLAGAVEALETTKRRIALVSHRSSQKILPHQKDLAAALVEAYPGRVLPIRIYASRTGGGDAKEDTQRCRSFLYASLGFVVARMFGVDRLRFYENGVVSINLPISEQVQGAMATRTTHPLGLKLVREFLGLVAEAPVDLANPFIWKTKADIFGILKRHGRGALARTSVSCSEVRRMTKLTPHCGCCSQCIDRRYGALSADMGEDDPAEMYAVDLMTGRRERDQDRTMAVDYTRHALALATMSDITMFTKFSGEFSRVVEGFPEMPIDEVGSALLDLFRRHGAAVEGVIDAAIKTESLQITRRSLPRDSLLGLWTQAFEAEGDPPTAANGLAYLVEPARLDDAVSSPRSFPTQDGRPLQLAIDRGRKEARVLDVATLKGRSFDLLAALAGLREVDLKEHRRVENYAFAAASNLADAFLTTDTESIRQIVKRTREDLAEHLEVLGFKASEDILIETSGTRRGYRLNTRVNLVSPEEG